MTTNLSTLAFARRMVCVGLTVVLAIAAATVGAVPARASAWRAVPCGNPAALVQAINDAQAGTGSTSILLGGGAGCTYTLTAIDNTGSYGPNGLPVITKRISICGNGSAGVPGSTITRDPAAPNFRLFEIASGGSLSLSCQVTLSNGHASDGTNSTDAVTGNGANGGTGQDGGAIRVDSGGTLTFTSGTIANNRAGDGGKGGGGGGGLTPGNGGDAGNGGNGGGILAGGTVTLSNVAFSGNTAGAAGTPGAAGIGTLSSGRPGTNGNLGHGGAIYNDNGTVTLKRQNTFTANSPDNCAPTASVTGC